MRADVEIGGSDPRVQIVAEAVQSEIRSALEDELIDVATPAAMLDMIEGALLTVPSRQLLDEIDLPLLILFASLFVINDAFARAGIIQEAMTSIVSSGWLPHRISFLMPMTLLLSNTIGNVPAVVMLLTAWQGIPSGVLIGLAVLSTLAGNFVLVGSLANLIVAERALVAGVKLSFMSTQKRGCRLPFCRCSLPVCGYGLLD